MLGVKWICPKCQRTHISSFDMDFWIDTTEPGIKDEEFKLQCSGCKTTFNFKATLTVQLESEVQ